MRGTQRSRQAASLRNIGSHAAWSAFKTNAAQLDATTNRPSTRSAASPPTHSARRTAEQLAVDLARGQADSACASVIPIESPRSAARGQQSMICAIRSDCPASRPSTTTDGHDAISCRSSRPDEQPCSCLRSSWTPAPTDRRSRWSARQSATRVTSRGHRGKCSAMKRLGTSTETLGSASILETPMSRDAGWSRRSEHAVSRDGA
ncbi:MAG: hypothetical protein RLY21_1512 [Planctomycetota bacterium]